MDFEFTQEQQQFSDALRRWMEKDYTFEHRKKILHSETGVSSEAWSTLAELGMTALPVPEEQGGFNGSAVDMMVVMKEIGRGLVVEPYLATALGAQFLKLAGKQETLLEQVATGELKLAAALGEKQARFDLFDITTTAAAGGDGYVLNGTKVVVIHGGQADQLIVSARSSGAQRDTSGISLFLVPANAAGV
ncbi:MAG: acyl-CoA dehydrogenase family protein, partial [Burkholderiaceae bacterium]